MIYIKSEEEIEKMRKGGKILAQILENALSKIEIGITTREIDNMVGRLCLKYGVRPAFKGYKPNGARRAYPANLCISVNDEIVHGIPGEREIENGDIVTLDFGVLFRGYITDAARSMVAGEATEQSIKLVEIAKTATLNGIDSVKEGSRVGDISSAIQRQVEDNGYNVFKSLAGHGVGRDLHEDPLIPNFGMKNTGDVLKSGMTLAIETMVVIGKGDITVAKDGWTLKTADGSMASQFEHTILVTKDSFEILTEC